MDLSTFIVSVFCLIDDRVEDRALRARGPLPKLSDIEVLTIEVVEEFLGMDIDEAIFRHFGEHYGEWFPALAEVHRTTFARQAANLWTVKERLWQELFALAPLDPALALVDSTPLPVCLFARAYRCRRFRGEAKPRGLMAKLVQNYVPEGGSVLDPFSGGGSTLDAAALLGRRAVGFEFDPRFHGRAERQLDRVRRASVELRKRWLDEALAKVFVEPRGLATLPVEPMGLEALVMEALSESTSSRLRPLFDEMEQLFAHMPRSPYAMLSEEIRKLDRLGAA